MEETKNIQQSPIPQPQAPQSEAQKPVAQQPIVSQPPVTPPPPNKKSPVFMLLLLGIIIILFIAAFFVMSKKNQAPQTPIVQTPTATQTYPTVEPTSIPSPTSTLEEQEVEKVTIDEKIDADFNNVDNDLKKL